MDSSQASEKSVSSGGSGANLSGATTPQKGKNLSVAATEVKKGGGTRAVPGYMKGTAATAVKTVKTKEELKTGVGRGAPVRLFNPAAARSKKAASLASTTSKGPMTASKGLATTAKAVTSTKGPMTAKRPTFGPPPTASSVRKPRTFACPPTTAKPRVAVSSFIAEELKNDECAVRADCVTPDHHDWDASAIAPPSNRILANVINSSVSSDPSNSGIGVGSTSNLGNNTTSASTAEHEDDSTLADDYLISCLIESNTLRNLERVTEGCQTQVGEVFAATEKTRSEVIRMRAENRELRSQLEFVKNYRKIRQPLEEIAGNLPEQELGSLLKGLKQCQNHLKVTGLKVGPGSDPTEGLCNVFASLVATTEKGNFASDDQTLEMSRRVGEVSAGLSDTVDLFDKCKKGKERVNKSSTHLRALESDTKPSFGFNLVSSMALDDSEDGS